MCSDNKIIVRKCIKLFMFTVNVITRATDFLRVLSDSYFATSCLSKEADLLQGTRVFFTYHTERCCANRITCQQVLSFSVNLQMDYVYLLTTLVVSRRNETYFTISYCKFTGDKRTAFLARD